MIVSRSMNARVFSTSRLTVADPATPLLPPPAPPIAIVRMSSNDTAETATPVIAGNSRLPFAFTEPS